MVPAKRETYYEEYAPKEQPREPERIEQPRPANKHVGIGRQIRLVLSVLSIALVGLALVGGYERLALAHQANMKLRDEIRASEIYIEDLTVELAYAMDPTSVQEIASKRLGMDYPTEEQLVKVEPPAVPQAPEDAPAAMPSPSPTPPPSPEQSFVMPDVARVFREDEFKIIGIDE